MVVIVLNDTEYPKPSKLESDLNKELKQALNIMDTRQENRIKSTLGEWKGGEAPRRVTLNEILSDQIDRIGEFTDVTHLEFGALIMKDNDGVKLEFIQIGESRSVEIRPTRKLLDDEFVLGTYHQHPKSDRLSLPDIQSFLSNDWEEIMLLRGAHATIICAIKTINTKIGVELTEIDETLDNKELGEKYMFALYRGTKPDNLQLLNVNMGDSDKIRSLDDIVKELKGTKSASYGVKKLKWKVEN